VRSWRLRARLSEKAGAACGEKIGEAGAPAAQQWLAKGSPIVNQKHSHTIILRRDNSVLRCNVIENDHL
jgi:hypothetical protein